MDNTHTETQLPIFSNIYPAEIEADLKKIISENRVALTHILNDHTDFTWDNLISPLDDMEDRLAQFWAPISHVHAVCQSEPLRAAYNACLPLLSEYHSELMQNEKLYRAVQSIAASAEYQNYNAAQRKVIENELRDFRLAGVHLPPQEKAQASELQKKSTQLSNQFAENILDATHAWFLHVTDGKALEGLPEQTLKWAEQSAAERSLSGWVFTLDYPFYSAVMKYLSNRELRWLMYEAYTTRASNVGPQAGRFDNTPIMDEILKVRHAYAKCLGFDNFAEYSLVPKMANDPQLVLKFLYDLVEKSKAPAQQEFNEIVRLAQAEGIEKIEAWDLAYYTEKCRVAQFAFSQEDLRSYFPIDQVMQGMFSVVNKLFGLTITEKKGVDVWHPHVRFFEIQDESQQVRGYFYTDLYARPQKREGAWMDDCRIRRRLKDGTVQLPIAFLTCNFAGPIDNKPALLTHDDVQTLFHEFGHCLHHLLTKVDYSSVSGINGVAWDAVEFPSQFLEQWCFEKEVLDLISSHVETGNPLPNALYNKLLAAKNFQAGMQMLRQLEFALFDFRLHLEWSGQENQVQNTLNEVRKAVSIVPVPKFNRFQNSFSHIFAGGYCAGYYSYKWAEVLSADAFGLFLEKGIFDKESGLLFLKHILEKGGTEDPMQLFIQFRGRKPEVEALLQLNGLA